MGLSPQKEMPPAEWRSLAPRSTGGPTAPAAGPLTAQVAARQAAAQWTEGMLQITPGGLHKWGGNAHPLLMPPGGPGITPGAPPATGVPNPQDPLGGGDRALWVVLATVPRLG